MDINYYKQYEPIFGSWHITRLIGEGSFGKVFEMERQDFGVTYKAALKTITVPASETELRDVMADGMDEDSVRSYYSTFVQDLAKEFALMSRLKGNSNVVSYENHQVIEHKEGIGWDILIQMELLTPLNEYIRKNTVTRQDVIKLGIDMCKALELCQKYNIIHRDVKPENIFVSENGDFKLGDFGIARTVEKTTSGLSKKGTYTYMAPEVYKGEVYGSTVDIYSLGIVLYRLLNENRTPFLPAYPAPITHSDRENALVKRFSGAPLPPPNHADGRLAEIVLKACAFDPKDRYSSPMQMRQELEAILYNREESQYIYPEGDEIPQKSVQYIRTGDELSAMQIEATQKDAGTVSVFGKTVSDFGGTVSNFSGGTAAQKKAEVPPESKKHGRKLWIAVSAAGLLVVVLAVALFSKGDSGTEALLSADPTQTIRDERGDTVQESVSETTGDSGAETLLSADPTQTIRDEQGNIVQDPISETTGDSGTETLLSADLMQTIWDEQGNIVQEPISNSTYAVYEYDENGNRIKESDYKGDGTLTGYYLYEYDENGNQTKESYYVYFMKDWRLTTFKEFDENGRLTKRSLYNLDGTLFDYNLYEYDENGNNTRANTYNADGTLTDYYLYEYDENGNKTKESRYRDDGRPISSGEYDENGNKTKESWYADDGTLMEYYLYEYDENGNLTKSSYYNADGTPR